MAEASKDNKKGDEEEEVVETYEEVPAPHIIETGDSVKVKQVLDDAAMAAIVDAGYEANYSWDNFKLFLMFISCVFAMIAQFYPLPFPDSRLLLAACCGLYFIISTVLQFIVVFVDKDTIMFTKASKNFPTEMKIRSSFPRFQEYFTLTIQPKDSEAPQKVGKMYVGKYFTAKGEFDEDVFKADVRRHVQSFVDKDYKEIEYNHKMD
jgi:signal peptidase complex subunit 2